MRVRYPEENNISDRETIVRQLEEIATREWCDWPVTLQIAIMRLFAEQTESRFGPAAWAEARYKFTRCGAIKDVAPPATLRCVRRRGHAGEHLAVSGERWADKTAAVAQHPGIGRSIRLFCFSGCGAVATDGRFCLDHRHAP